MIKLLVEKLSFDSLIYLFFFKRGSIVTFVRISKLAHIFLPFFTKITSCRFDHYKKFPQDVYLEDEKINCSNDQLNILDRLMKEYCCDLSSLSSLLGASNEKMMHQLKIHSWHHFYHIAQSISIAKIIDADELILHNTINRKKIESLFSNIIYVRNYIDCTKVKSRVGFYGDTGWIINFRYFFYKICFYFVSFALYKVMYFFKNMFKKDDVLKTLDPIIGVWVTREIEEGFAGDVSWINNSIKAKDIHLFIDRKQAGDLEYSNTDCSSMSVFISTLRNDNDILLASLKDNFSKFTKAFFVLLKSNNKLVEKITILYFLSESLQVKSLLQSKGVVILYNQKVAEKFSTTIACDMLDIVQISGTWSNTPRHHMIYSDSADVIFTWSDMIRNNFIQAHSLSKFYVNVSPPSIDIIEYCRSMSKTIIRENHLQDKNILGVFDSPPGELYGSINQYNKCWDAIIDIVINNDIYLLFKPKDLDDFVKNFPSVYKKLSILEEKKKCFFIFDKKGRPPPLVIGFISDLMVGFSTISSAVTEASVSGTPGIHIQLMCSSEKHDLFKHGRGRYIFTEIKSAKKEILDFFQNQDISKIKMSTKEYNLLVDPHKGEKTYLRAEYISILYNLLLTGFEKDTAILKTNNEFKKIHGEEVVTYYSLLEFN